MLQMATVESGTLGIIKQTSIYTRFKESYRLVGGTALSPLRMGHRKSVDLDLFCHGFISMTIRVVACVLKENKIKVLKSKSTSVFYGGYIKSVKVDFCKKYRQVVEAG